MANYTITLKETREVAVGTRFFVFDKPDGFVFKAGQYIAMVVPKAEGIEPDTRGLARSLSIASAPCEPELYFAMRQGESAFKRTCWQLKPGDTVTVTKAVGFFVLPSDDTRPIVFLAGGIGITPVRSILKQAEYEKSNRSFTLFYSNRFIQDAAFDEEVRNMALANFRLITVLSKSQDLCAPGNDERGYICEPLLKKYLGDNILNCLYYIVGSPQFSEAIEKILIDLGVPKEQRHMDPFTGLRGVEKK